MSRLFRALGLMSGTSLDGVDAAMIETDGAAHIRPLGTLDVPYDAEDRALMKAALADAVHLSARHENTQAIVAAAERVTSRHIEAIRAYLAAYPGAAPEIIGFHGQTVLHRPETGLTIQIGDPQAVATETGIPVIADLRLNDMAHGGQGAPLLPVYHMGRVAMLDREGPVAVVNLGGVGNITVCTDPPLAFDTGPANALLDDFMNARTGTPVDFDGATAARGTPDLEAVNRALNHPFFVAKPPKSLDRDTFAIAGLDDMSLENGAATLTAFTAHALARAADLLPVPPKLWIIVGGGSRNPTLLAMIADVVAGDVVTGEDVGWDSFGIEAEGFAYMAVRSTLGLPITFPSTTGIDRSRSGGVRYDP